MKDKLKKITIGLFLLFTFITPTYAKKMKVSDLEAEVEKRVSGAREIYVIGNYAFTNKHELQIQDFMLAAKTINVAGDGKDYSQSIYDAMTINRISRSRDANTGSFKPWEIQSKNLVGKTTLTASTELDIRYIDYQFVPETTPIKNNSIKIFKDSELSSLGSNYQNYFSSFQKNDETLNFNYDESSHTINVTGVALRRETISPISLMSVKRIANTKVKYYIGLVIEIPEANNNTKVIEKNWDIKDGNGKTITLIDNDGSKGVGLIIELSSTASSKKTIISIDLDGSEKEYEATTLTIDWSKVEFEQDSKATFNTEVSENDKTNLKIDGYNYETTYNIVSSVDNNYKITGNITEQTVKGVKGYYFAYTIKPTNPKTTMEITVPCNNCEEGTRKINYQELKNGQITILHKIDAVKDTGNKFTITVDDDGAGRAYGATKFTFDYSALILVKSSKSKVLSEVDDYTKFNDKKWTKSGDYKVSFSSNDSTVSVTGLIPIHEASVDDLKNTNYYLMYEIETPTTVTESTTVTLNNNDKLIKVYDGNKLYVLQSIESVNRGFTITIDMDGDSIEYTPYQITMLVGGLKLQKKSTESTYSIATANDFNSSTWNFDFTKNTDLSFASDTLKGTVREQTLDNSTFESQDGYYVPIKISLPSNITDGQSFTIKAKTETEEKDVTINAMDRNNRYVALLFKLTRDNDQTITYTIDYDGEGKEYLEEQVTINYSSSSVTFKTKNTVTFKDAENDTLETQVVYEGDMVKEPTQSLTNPAYHTFKYWVKSDAQSLEYTFDTPLGQDDDITLMPHWTIDVDKFVNDVVDNFNEGSFKDKLTKNEKNITADVLKPEVSTSELNDTILPGVIEYVLNKKEIKGLTLKIGSESFKFTNENKTAIQEKITELLTSAKLNDKTLEVLGDITISLDAQDKAENISLESATYTLNFTSKFAVVEDLDQIEKALADANITVIYVKSDITLEKTLDINVTDSNRRITIKSLSDIKTIKDSEKTMEGESDVRPVIKVTAGNITFENLKIQGATRAISVLEGATVTANNVTAVDSQDAGFDVAKGAKFIGTDIKYQKADGSDKENYSYPTVCGLGSVSLKKTQDGGEVVNANPKVVTNYERIRRNPNGIVTDEYFKDPETGKNICDFFEEGCTKLKDEYNSLLGTERYNYHDSLVQTGHTHYYLKPENGVYKKFYFRDSRLNAPLTFFFGGGEEIYDPIKTHAYKYPTDIFHFYQKVQEKDGQVYVFAGWSLTEGTKGIGNEAVELSWNNTNYYSHYEKGYKISIKMMGKVNSDGGVTDGEVTGVFGITETESQEGATIQTLIEKEPEFKIAWEELKKQGKPIRDKSSQIEINESTKIDKNLELELGELNPTSLSMKTIGEDNYKVIGNKVSGIINTQNVDDNKYYLPLTLTSTEFKDGKSTVTITDPNGHEEKYTYSSSTDDGISLASNDNTMKINLEVLKSSKIKNNNSKIYNVAIDVDGAEDDTYAIKSYDLDLTELKTAEELINNAAKNTQNATTLTMIKNNYIKGGREEFTYKYDKNSEVTYYKDDNDEEYTFRLRKVVTDHEGPITIILRKNKVTEGSPEINGWKFANFLTEVTKGTHEITLLQDVMKKTTLEEINAIEKVKDLGDHKYEVTLSKARLNEWLNSAYLDEKADDGSLTEDNNANVVLEVELDESGKYLVSMKTKDNFSIISNDKTIYKTNYINVKYENINETNIETPLEFLSNENKTITVEDIKSFYEECIKWHKKVNKSEIYEG